MTIVHRNPGITLMGTNEIEGLQRALNNLSTATQKPQITVKVTGVIDDATMAAISEGLGLLTSELPSWLYLGLQAAMAIGASNATAKKYVGQYATQLTLAANAAAVKFKVNPPVPTPAVTASAGFFAPGWYKTPIGIGLIAVVGFIGYRLLFAASSASTRKAA